MASSSATRRLEELDLSGTSGTVGGSTESEYQTAVSCGGEHGSTACSLLVDPARTESKVESSVEQQIERSRVHWSELAQVDLGSITDVEANNRQVFRTLQSHPEWGFFFLPFGEGTRRSLVVGKKFAEGGQAELFHAHVTWNKAEHNERDRREGIEWVVKVFKKGTLLQHLHSQFPHGFLQYRAERRKRTILGIPPPIRYHCDVFLATLLEDGRFAFLMQREEEDLRSVIDRRMRLKTNGDCGPFSKEEVEAIMWKVASGMDWLHNRNIVHRDLKASNVLVGKGTKAEVWICYVSDFECSVGVVGTGFFRAPEILQACRDNSVSRTHELFTRAVDVYSYGMMCYEVLTGKLPFEGHPSSDFDHVLNGHRPEVPNNIDDWIHELLNRCWQANPRVRPSFEEVLNLLVANSAVAQDLNEEHRSIEEVKRIEWKH